jgi:hypothetical protein
MEMQMMPTLSIARLARRLAGNAIAAALALAALLPGPAHAAVLSPPSVPNDIKVPAGNVPFLLGHATGTQNYTCQPSSTSSTGFAWTFTGPSATLVDDGKEIITHFAVPAGPVWKGIDGSSVVGARVAGVTVSPNAIPWLLLSAKSTTTPSGPGGIRLHITTYIQRVNTTGGLAPTSVCDTTTAGNVARVPYTADYYFYKAT